MNRRTFIRNTAALLPAAWLPSAAHGFASGPDTKYRRADFAPLRDSGYGIGVHWIARTMPRHGEPLSFAEAVRRFDVEAFVQCVKETGAGHVLFTVNHGVYHLCCPNPEVDRVLPGRTAERDLPMELADALLRHNIRLILYYSPGWDTDWKKASGMAAGQPRFFDTWIRIVAWMGEHYGKKLVAWWFDDGSKIRAAGQPPWKEMTAAAKAGFADRLVCYNAGIEQTQSVTRYQDYWAGECVRLNYIPREPTADGLPWYGFVSWHGDSRKPRCAHWYLTAENLAFDWPAPPAQSVLDFYRGFRRVGGTVAFNLLCYQDGSIYDSDLAVMKAVKQQVGSQTSLESKKKVCRA